MKKLLIILLLIFIWPLNTAWADDLPKNLAGRILLQVESNGEAWYLSPDNLMRYFLGRPADALAVMREQGRGITNANLEKIPAGSLNKESVGPENEYTSGIKPFDINLAQKLSGQILLQVQSRGEAWYVNPADYKRYFLGRPADALAVMRAFGIGISNADLAKIISRTPNYNIGKIEKEIFGLINEERKINKLAGLKWDEDLARVAREHSRDLAEENKAFTGLGVSCDFPIIHHEGLKFGADNAERLNNRAVYYFSKSGENIALMPGAKFRYSYKAGDNINNEVAECQKLRTAWDNEFDKLIHEDKTHEAKAAIVKAEISKRTEKFLQGHDLNVVNIAWQDEIIISKNTVDGWMNSPGHKKNILDSDYDETGIGAAYVNGYVITTQVFIKRADCGFKYGACCEKDGYYPYCYEPLNCANKACF